MPAPLYDTEFQWQTGKYIATDLLYTAIHNVLKILLQGITSVAVTVVFYVTLSVPDGLVTSVACCLEVFLPLFIGVLFVKIH